MLATQATSEAMPPVSPPVELPVYSHPKGWAASAEEGPIHPSFPHVHRRPPLPRTDAILHMFDGEGPSVAAIQSERVQAAFATLPGPMRSLKLNPERTGREQPCDKSHGFMSGHTQTKRGTNTHRPVAPSIKVLRVVRLFSTSLALPLVRKTWMLGWFIMALHWRTSTTILWLGSWAMRRTCCSQVLRQRCRSRGGTEYIPRTSPRSRRTAKASSA